jgi:hypothetical protein
MVVFVLAMWLIISRISLHITSYPVKDYMTMPNP